MVGVHGLVIVERAYRGAVETQFSDALYFLREMNRQMERLDLALRGLAVTYAVDAPPVPAVRVPSRHVATLPDPRRSVAALLDEGVTVTADVGDLRRLGLGADRLLPGVACADTSLLAPAWADYDGVWFL